MEAARGVNFYMKVNALTFAMPSAQDGVAAIQKEFEDHGTDQEQDVLHIRASSQADRD